jgi:hypothetical protein
MLGVFHIASDIIASFIRLLNEGLLISRQIPKNRNLKNSEKPNSGFSSRRDYLL